jgi:hypothetical protein
MKKAIVALVVMMSALSANANQRDARLFDALLNSNAATDGGMGHTYVTTGDIACVYNSSTKRFKCLGKSPFTDGTGAFNANPKASKVIFNYLVSTGAKIKKYNGRLIVRAHEIDCSQTNEGLYDPELPVGERTSCSILPDGIEKTF